MARPIMSEYLYRELVKAGVFREDERVVRCIIDLKIGDAVVMHVQRWGDDRLFEVAPLLRDAEVREVGKGADDAS